MKTSTAINNKSENFEQDSVRIHFDGDYIQAKSTTNSSFVVKHFSRIAIGWTCVQNDAVHDEMKELKQDGYQVLLTPVSREIVVQFISLFSINKKYLEEDDAWEGYLAFGKFGRTLTPNQHIAQLHKKINGF